MEEVFVQNGDKVF